VTPLFFSGRKFAAHPNFDSRDQPFHFGAPFFFSGQTVVFSAPFERDFSVFLFFFVKRLFRRLPSWDAD